MLDNSKKYKWSNILNNNNQDSNNKLVKGPLCALELFSNHFEQIKIVTMCKSFDTLLGGGLSVGNLIEICGPAGIGKTQLCFQTCVSVQIPACIGGLSGQVVYIDTEGSFSTDRLLQIAHYTIRHCKKIAASMKLKKEELKEVDDLTERKMLDNIFYFRCTDQICLMALSYRLDAFCKEHSRVRLIIIDSIAFHFRYDVDDIPKRNQFLSVFGHNMSRIASVYGISVILTNQMTTKFNNGAGYAAPALGDSWGHICPIRIQLEDHSSELGQQKKYQIRHRRAALLKHTSQPLSKAIYQITIGGIRDTID